MFTPSDGYVDQPVSVRCGSCIGCRLERARGWAVRCMHEASLHEENSFLTLTYADENLPAFGSLDRKVVPAFVKRLRKSIAPKRVRFFYCGEYGDQDERPHYHMLLFGHQFADAKKWKRSGDHYLKRSAELERLWPFGHSWVGDVSYKSAAYVARYVVKKVSGELADAHYSRVNADTGEVVALVPEFAGMSLRPGIASAWLADFGREVYSADSVIVEGREAKPPRYYDEQMKKVDAELVADVVRTRKAFAVSHPKSLDRVLAEEHVTEARLSLKRR